jgi:hypothetical protein
MEDLFVLWVISKLQGWVPFLSFFNQQETVKSRPDQLLKMSAATKRAKEIEAAALGAVAMVSHELCNASQAIAMSIDTMLNEGKTQQQLHDLAVICNVQLQHHNRSLHGAIQLAELLYCKQSEANNVSERTTFAVCSVKTLVGDVITGM